MGIFYLRIPPLYKRGVGGFVDFITLYDKITETGGHLLFLFYIKNLLKGGMMNGMCKRRFYRNHIEFGHEVAALIEENMRQGDEGKLGGVDKRNKGKFNKKSTRTITSAHVFPASWNNLFGI